MARTQMPALSRRHLMAGALALGLIAGPGLAATPPAAPGDYVITEGNPAALAGTKRVIITNFTVAFQMDGSVRNNNATTLGNLTLMGGNANEVAARMAWQSPDTALMQDIADAGLAQLKADFRARGIEVVEETALAGLPAYASILAATGLKSLEDYPVVAVSEAQFRKTSIGPDARNDAKIVSARGLTPYNHSVFEGGQCCQVTRTLPSSKVYYVPGFEAELARTLNATVVKAWQFVYFTQIDAGVRQDGWAGGVGGAVVTFNASARSAVRIGEQKTRLSFRLPASPGKPKNVPTSWAAKDGDVVVSLGRPLLIGDSYFKVDDTGATGAQNIRASLGGTQHFNFGATLTDPQAYRTDVAKGMGQVLDGMVGTALGQ